MIDRVRGERRYSAWLLALIAASLVPIAIGLATATRRADVDSPLVQGGEATEGPVVLASRRVGTLPVALQDAAVTATRPDAAVLLGGLDASGSSRTGIETLSRGQVIPLAHLKTPLHDAAAVAIGRSVYLFGGGQASSEAGIVRLDPRTGVTEAAGRMPEPRSDLGAATVGGSAYLIGGFTGQTPLDTILAWTPASGTGGAMRIAARMPQPLRYAAVASAGGRIVIAGGLTPGGPSRQVLSFDPASGRVAVLGSLPRPISHATAATLGDDVYLIGGRDAGGQPVREMVAIDLQTGATTPAGALPAPLSDAAAVALSGRILLAGGRTSDGPVAGVLELVARRPSPTPLLRAGSDPRVLPGNVLIADKANNRLVEVTPEGKIVWVFPRPGDLSPGQTFLVPDDAFFTHDGRLIVATQEDNYVISVIDAATRRFTYRYGHPGVPGAGPGYVYNPDDAIMLRGGHIVSADIKNCRLIELSPPLQRPVRQVGATGGCVHSPPSAFASPNGAFPLSDGGTVVTEIQGVWADVFDRSGKLRAAINVPGFSYPSDTNEARPGVYLSVDYASPGAITEFDQRGHVLWRFSPGGPDALDHPSLALPLPNGDVLANDDYNDRVIVVDPRTNRIVWQYGHTGVAGSTPGYLHIPDGVDVAPPYALTDRFPGSTGLPGG
jgi:outer membrane protein assembly factor BamB